MYKKELIVIRHARSKYNMRETTDLDAGITEFGIRQSTNVGKFLHDKIDLSDYDGFTSPFLRCLETTEYIRSGVPVMYPGGKFTVMSELREYLNHSGECVGVACREEDRPWHHWIHYPKEGMIYTAEHNEIFLRRMHAAYQKLPERSIVVTHGLPALLLIDIATKNSHSVPVWDHSIDNCSVTYIINGRVVWYGRNIPHEEEYKTAVGGIHDFDNFKVNKF